MIPQKIHYCWFGGNEKPDKVIKCINSWKKYCNQYELIEWSESNFNVNMNPYTKWCYDNKKYAFLTDYVRLLVIEQHGGIYFDTDVEVVKNIDELLSYDGFFGFETKEYVNTGLGFGSVPHHPILSQMLKEYDRLLDAKSGVVNCPLLNTEALKKFGLKQDGSYQIIENIQVFPIEYFNPFDSQTGKLTRTKNTYSIHWYAASWMSSKERLRGHLTRPLHRILWKFTRKNS